MELIPAFSVVSLAILVVCSQTIADKLHLEENIVAQIISVTSTLQVDHSSGVYFVEEGKDVYFRCIQREETPSCRFVSYLFNGTPITQNGVLTNTTSTHYSYHDNLNGIELLVIKNVTWNDSGRYSCLCRQSKGRTLFGENLEKNDVLYISSIDVMVAVMHLNHTCISNSSDVIINDTIEFKCMRNDAFLYFENVTKSLNLKAVTIQATESFNNTRILCLELEGQQICSFSPLNIHTRIRPLVTLDEAGNHTVEFTCSSIPHTRNLSWDISTVTEPLDLQITVRHVFGKSTLHISNIVKSFYGNVTCTATLRGHTASTSWGGLLQSLETSTLLIANQGNNLRSQDYNFSFVLLWTFVCAGSLFAFLFLMKVVSILCKNSSEMSKSELNYDERESMPSATTTVNNSTENRTVGIRISRDEQSTAFMEEGNIEDDNESYNNSSSFVRLDDRTNGEDFRGAQETSDGDSATPPVAAPRVNTPSTLSPSQAESEVRPRIKRFVSKTVSGRVGSRRTSLFEDDNDESLMSSRISLGGDDVSACQDDQGWIRSRSYEALSLDAETFAYQPRYGIRLRMWDLHDDSMPPGTEEPVYAIPIKRKKTNREVTSSTSSDQVTNRHLAHLFNLNKFPPNTSPNVSQLRLNKWRSNKS